MSARVTLLLFGAFALCLLSGCAHKDRMVSTNDDEYCRAHPAECTVYSQGQP